MAINTNRNTMNVRSHMRLFGDLSFDTDNGSFPEDPSTNQISLVEGILYVFSSINGVRTWYPLTHKKASYIHTQAIAASEWIVSHNEDTSDYGFFVYDDAGSMQYANVETIDTNTVKIILSTPTSGKAVMFFDYEITAKSITAGSLNVTSIDGMFSKVADDIIFEGNLIPSTAAWTIGNALNPISALHVAANTIYLGDTATLSGTTLDLGTATGTSAEDAPTIIASNFVAEPYTYNDGGGDTTVDATVDLKDSIGNSNTISYKNDTGTFSLNKAGVEGSGELEVKTLTATNTGGTALIVEGDTSTTGEISASALAVTGAATIDTATFTGITAYNQPLVFTEDATIGDGDDNVTLNCGALNLFQVISQHFNLDAAGNLGLTGDLNVQGTLTTAVHDTTTSTASSIASNYFESDGGGTLDSGLKVNRGGATVAVMHWNEVSDQWESGLLGAEQPIVLDNDSRLLSTLHKTDLIDAGDTTLHFHADDRDRANHTGTQLVSTISDFTNSVNSLLATPLSLKQDASVGLGLSEDNFTTAEKTKLASIDPAAIGGAIEYADILNKPNVYYQSAIPADDLTQTEVDELRSGKLANGDAPVPTLSRPTTIFVTEESVLTYTVAYEPTFVMVYIGRQLLRPDEFVATNGTDITFTIPLALDDEIDVVTAIK